MSFIHDIIKLKYIHEGYLPNYPPHLISDEEMCDAFLKYPVGEARATYLITSSGAYLSLKGGYRLRIGEATGDPTDDAWDKFKQSTEIMWFKDKYPLLVPELEPQYRALVEDIVYYLDEFKASVADDRKLPDWVYSYMLGDVLSVDSNINDLHDMFVALNVDNIDDVFTPEAQSACYITSYNWLKRFVDFDRDHRHPGLFGEPHVIKSIRLSS